MKPVIALVGRPNVGKSTLFNRLTKSRDAIVADFAGLDLDFAGQPFGPMPALMAEAEDVTKVHAVCTVCGSDASRSQRVVASDSVVLVGAVEAYEARCRTHWSPLPQGGHMPPESV